MSESERASISLGLKNLDSLLRPEGLQTKNVAFLSSNVISDSNRLLVRLVAENSPQATMISLEHSQTHLDNVYNQLYEEEGQLDVIAHDELASYDLINAFEEIDLDSCDVVVIDSINQIHSIEENKSFMNQIKEIAVENNIVILFHYIGQLEELIPPNPIYRIVYQSDAVLSLHKQKEPTSVRQMLYINKLPVQTQVDTNKIETPVVEIEFTDESLAVDVGKRI